MPRLVSWRWRVIFITRAEAVSPSNRREMILKENTKLSLTRQCKLLKISRSSIYYTPVEVNAETLKLMHEIDRISTKCPFLGNRQIAAYFPQPGFSAGRHRVPRLMNSMEFQAIYQGANHQQGAAIAPHLSVPAEKGRNHAAQSGLVQRHYLDTGQERVFVSDGDHGFGDQQNAVLAVFQYARF